MRVSYRIDAVLFDFDGTLTQPGSLDFSVIKSRVGCPPHMPVLEFISAIADTGDRTAAMRALDDFETDGARRSTPRQGAEALIDCLRKRALKVGIITRNSARAVHCALENFPILDADHFDLIISRDNEVAPKPSPEGVLLAARQLGVLPANLLVVGDFHFDVDAGKAAGALTALIDGTIAAGVRGIAADFHITNLTQLIAIVEMGRPLETGKLPNPLLETLLADFAITDPSVILASGIGEDTAAVDIAGNDTLILKSDPITFATDAIGRYAVVVNANDIATSGAKPRWMLSTLLFPPGVTGADIGQVMADLQSACAQWDITLCGGHTEITDAVSRPVVIGMMAGTVGRSRLIDKKRMREGDKILMTKAVAVEGTAIIAREFHDALIQKGLSREEVSRCRGFLQQISILPEAAIAAAHLGVSAMHDVTEGGLATAVRELGIAGGHHLTIAADQVPVFPETRRIADAMGIAPLGLIGSGSLLICCRPETAEALIALLTQAGIQATDIGAVGMAGRTVSTRDGSEWPEFPVDEITRLFN
ncbi:MAG: HAD-IA family hydrolase [Pseudomonadota bacterium]